MSKAFRKKQLDNHYFNHFSLNPDEITDIPRAELDDLIKQYYPEQFEVVANQIGDDGETLKTLYKLNDGNLIEAVLMFYPDRATLCLSCQVGCAMACPFCATGTLGLTRNLTTSEILEQVRRAAYECKQRNRTLTNIVFMGMGEPTQNLDAIFAALDRICTRNDREPSFNISPRNLTISTVGNVPRIKRLTNDPRAFRLAISLHAPTNALRDELVPINQTHDLDTVLDAALAYYQAKQMRVSIEYALMKDINDSQKHAYTLAKVLNRRGSGWVHVNLIPLNEVSHSKWTAATPEATARFVEILKSKGVATTLRDSRGQDIDAACGQLAAAKGE